MRDDGDLALAAVRRLPPDLVAGLRATFVQELAERLPALRAAVESGDAERLPGALRDAHSLGSSAAVLGEPEASRAARAAEAALLRVLAGDDEQALAAARAGVSDLADALAGWTP